MYECMHVYMYELIYVCTYARMYICVGEYMYVCVYVGKLCMYVCMYVCMHVCINLCRYVCMYVRTYVRTHACIYVCVYILYVFMYACVCLDRHLEMALYFSADISICKISHCIRWFLLGILYVQRKSKLKCCHGLYDKPHSHRFTTPHAS